MKTRWLNWRSWRFVREQQQGDVAYLERRIDSIVYRTYGVTKAEQAAR